MKNKLYLVAISALCFIAGCTGATDPNQIVFPATNVSYSQQVEPYFALACVSCHDDVSSLPLSSWIAIRDDIGVVVMKSTLPPIGDTVASELVSVMYGGLYHGPISANNNQRAGIKQWVLQGAPDN
jgi:hypothetical protein